MMDRIHPLMVCGLLLALCPGTTRLPAQAFDCVELNDSNTNIFVIPDECFDVPENIDWCNCARSIFTHPVRQEFSGFNQAVQWTVDQHGIGNHRVEVEDGTLDLSGLTVGQVIGGTEINELIPESVGVPPGTFFVILSEVRVTALNGNSADFDFVVTDLSTAALLILDYDGDPIGDPRDEAHSSGLLYRGRLTSLGPGNGFTLEYRYVAENVQPDADPPLSPAIEIEDAGSPGFTVRFLFRFFTTEAGIYTLPDAAEVEVTTTLRRFTDDSLDEILDLGTEDLCQIRDGKQADPVPCKILNEILQIKTSLDENSPPTARIVMVDPVTTVEIPDPAEIFTSCGSARIFFVGRNSDDGDGGLQELSYEWSVLEGPEGGAIIPEATRTFQDTEITFVEPGLYELSLEVDDGAAQDNTDQMVVEVIVVGDEINIPPLVVIVSSPEPPDVELVEGAASVTLDGSQSTDECTEDLGFLWSQTEGPAESVIVSPTGPTTEVQFSFPGTYIIRLGVDDGAPKDNVGTAQIEVQVTGEPTLFNFKRGDTDDNGVAEITDAIRSLNWLFIGGKIPACLDAADADDNGQVEITDAIRLLNFLFLGGEAPSDPGPMTCGPDPTDDLLADCSYESC